MSVSVSTSNPVNEEAKQLIYRLFASKNFLEKAIEYRLASDKEAFRQHNKYLNAEALDAIISLDAILPDLFPPPHDWQRLQEILTSSLHDDLAAIDALADQEERERLHQDFLKKIKERKNLEKKLIQNLNILPNIRTQLDTALDKIAICQKRAERYHPLRDAAIIFTDFWTTISSGPFPASAIGTFFASIGNVGIHYSQLIINRNNPDISRTQKTQDMGITLNGIVCAVTSAAATILQLPILEAAAAVAMPFLLPIIATNLLVNSIASTVTAFRNQKEAKKLPESPHKKIRMKGHFADVFANVADIAASAGFLGITLAITIGAVTAAFPPATLALLATAALGVCIASFTISTIAYCRKKSCLQKANTLKLSSEFENACKHGFLDSQDFIADNKTTADMRMIAGEKPKLGRRLVNGFFNLFSPDVKVTPPKPDMDLRCAYTSDNTLNQAKTIKQFETVLKMGFIPKLIDQEGMPVILQGQPLINITHLSPPDPLEAIEAIKKAGGMPKMEPKLEQQVLNAYHKKYTNRNRNLTYAAFIKTQFPTPTVSAPSEPSIHPFFPVPPHSVQHEQTINNNTIGAQSEGKEKGEKDAESKGKNEKHTP